MNATTTITTVVSHYQSSMLKEYAAKNGVTLVDFIDNIPKGVDPATVLCLHFDDDLSSVSRVSEVFSRGFALGVHTSGILPFFQRPSGQNEVEIFTGFVNLKTCEVVEWFPQSHYWEQYRAAEAAWLEAHAGETCPSCGHAKMELKDFSHGCGAVCYMCS